MSDVSQADCAATENADTKYPMTPMLRQLVEASEMLRERTRANMGIGDNKRGTEEIPHGERVWLLRAKLGLSETAVINLMRGQVRKDHPDAEREFLNNCGIPKKRACYTNALAPSMVRELYVVRLKGVRQSGHTQAIRRLATEQDWVVRLHRNGLDDDAPLEPKIFTNKFGTNRLKSIIASMGVAGLDWHNDHSEFITPDPRRIFIDDAAVTFQRFIRQDELYKQVGRCFKVVPTIVEVG